MKRNVFTMIGVVTVLAISGLGALTSYATGPGEVKTTQSTQVNIVIYSQEAVKQLGNWRQNTDGTWSFLKFNDQAVCNAWLESLDEPGAFYYVDGSGVMMVNATTPDGYQVDAKGLWRSGIKVQEGEAANSNSTLKNVDNGDIYRREALKDLSNPENQKWVADHTYGDAKAVLH